MYAITKIPKPDNLPAKKRQGGSKYPFGEMKVGDSFVVPYGDMTDGETALQFRDRVYKSAREYGRRNSKGDERMEFTAALMTEDDKSEVKEFVTGDVVVWRDK